MACIYARPSDNKTPSATLSLTAGAEDAAYPLTNLDDLRPDVVFKATGTSCTIRATFGSSQALQAIGLINHNLHGLTITVTNNGGMSPQSLIVPAVGDDALPINPWLDLRGVGSASGTQWNLAITGAAANVAIGELLLIATVRTMPIRWGVDVDERQPVILHRTDYHVPLKYGLGLRYRYFTGEVNRETERSAMTALFRDARGCLKPWWFVLEDTVNDAKYVQFDEKSSFRLQRAGPSHTPMTITLEEVCAGLAL